MRTVLDVNGFIAGGGGVGGSPIDAPDPMLLTLESASRWRSERPPFKRADWQRGAAEPRLKDLGHGARKDHLPLTSLEN